MKSFTEHLREAVIERSPLVKRAGKLKRDPKTVERLKKEFTHNGVTWINYTDIGHDDPYPSLLKNWGLPPEPSRDLMPLLWWVDSKDRVVIYEIPKGKSTADLIHHDIPQYRKAISPQWGGMTKYQGRIDRFRKTIILISGTTQSVLTQRALDKGKGRVASTLSRMFPGYTIIDRDAEGAIEL